MDILKSGGFKISALDIEYKLLAHPAITDVAVLGIPDDVLGQSVAALVVTSQHVSESELTLFSRDSMAKYQVPKIWKFLDKMPRNAMGKINKKDLMKKYFT